MPQMGSLLDEFSSSSCNECYSDKVAHLSMLVELHDYPDGIDLNDPDQAHNVGVV